jgi:hypothetical protein
MSESVSGEDTTSPELNTPDFTVATRHCRALRSTVMIEFWMTLRWREVDSNHWSREGGHRVNQHRTRTPKDFCAIPLIRHSESLRGGSPFGGDRDPTSDANLQLKYLV